MKRKIESYELDISKDSNERTDIESIEMEDSEDFEDKRVKSSYVVREGYHMKISEEWFESNRIKMFMISLNKKNEIGVDEALDVEQQVKLIVEGDDELEDEENTEKEESEMGQIVGTMKAFLVDRSGGGKFNFWCECDSINEDIYNIATEFTTREGRLIYDKIEGLDRETDNGTSSDGGFLLIDTMTLQVSERGHDLSLDMVDKLLEHLGGRWTIAWIVPFPESQSIDDDESEDEIQKANISLARHWARLGFIQASINKYECPDFWYLIPTRHTSKSKSAVANYPVILKEMRSLAADDTNELVKAVLGPEMEIVDKVTKLVNSGMDINQTETLFFAICNERNADIIKKLLELGANVNYKNKKGDTPLHIAAVMGNLNICQVLLQAGARKEANNEAGYTPFQSAVKNILIENQFFKTFDFNPNTEARYAQTRAMLDTLNLLIMDPSTLVGGILTPRMFYRLKVTAKNAGDVCLDSIEAEDFQNRIPIGRGTARYGVYLLYHVPNKEIPEQVYKSYAMGWQQQLEAIGRVMSRGVLPVQALVDQEMSRMDLCHYNHYRKNGGSLLHGLVALVEQAREESLSNGDGSFEECHGEGLEQISAMDSLDDDFLFVDRFLPSYCAGLV